MADADSTTNKSFESALNRIIEYRKQILSSGYDSLFTHGNLSDKRRIIDHMTMCGMIDELCEAFESEAINA